MHRAWPPGEHVARSTVAGYSSGSDGIHLFSEADSTNSVQLKVTYPWEDGTAFEESVEIAPGDERTWNGVVTEEREHTVAAKIDDGEGRLESANLWVTPGEEDSPTDANGQVRVHTVSTQGGPHPVVGVYFRSQAREE